MNKLTMLTVLLFFAVTVTAQSDNLRLASIDKGLAYYSYYETKKREPISVQADSRGGRVETYLKLNDGCTESYAFSWSFDSDISTLKVGQTVNATISANRTSGNCYNNSAKVTIGGTSTGSALLRDKKSGFSGIEIGGTNYAYALGGSHLPRSSRFSIKIGLSSISDEAFFTVRIATTTDASNDDVYDYEIRYMYKKGAGPNSTAASCSGLYGLGVNIGMLEYGSLKNDSPSFLIGFIDQSISIINQVGCLNTDYLKDLRSRMARATSSSIFNQEISNYRQRIAREIPEECE
ncbi:hypothetical protein [Allomuricauda sp. SCSIO 65647]|uniref:hypothetical protein n=1 Tax=Allomuricauda sp. SCSIO 65647 TaxID=2908843 RepID=UPI001F1BE789|nr:hypothetical protein [Muricauda sp. SCSIO 65647]UJH68415.1 hypothetical protein L0P89_04210 [Muricauda sp. SCSIO 65647]